MANYLTTEGICLRRIPYSNTSQVAGFLTPDVGRLSVLAKGVTRAPKKGVRTGFDLLARYGIVYTQRPDRSLQTLTDRWLKDDFRGLRRSLPRLLCGYYAAELALNFTMEGDPCPRLYRVTLETLRGFASGERLGAGVLRLETEMLREHGALPSFDRCVRCGCELPDRALIVFSASEGGTLCPDCEEPETGNTIPLRSDLLADLQALAAGGEASGVSARRIVALSTVVRFQMRYLLGKELRMWKYLQRRRLSKALRRLRRHAGPAG